MTKKGDNKINIYNLRCFLLPKIGKQQVQNYKQLDINSPAHLLGAGIAQYTLQGKCTSFTLLVPNQSI